MSDSSVHEQNTYQFGIPFNGANVSPSDTVDLTNPGILRVTVGGAVTCITVGGTTVTVTLGDKEWFPVKVQRVKSGGTSATGIQVFY
jgi:hypothetical protein